MLKALNVKLKDIAQNKSIMLFISLLFLVSTTTYIGAADYDFVWQTYLGKIIVTEHRFDGLKDLVWSLQYCSPYLDHEWLSNVIFYGLNVAFGEMGGLIAFKIIVEVLFTISIFYLIKQFMDIDTMSWFTYMALVCLVYSFATVLIKPKAYDLSVIMFIWLIIVVEKYKNNEIRFRTLAIWLSVIIILWNNLHSGSVVLAFGVLGLYWLFCFRDWKTLVLGLILVGLLCVNPFGYELIYFDITHFSDTAMKTVVKEWRSINLNFDAGKMIILYMVIGYLHILHMDRTDKKNWIYFVFYIVFLILTINSMRHFMYFVPILVIVFVKGQYTDLKQWKVKTFFVPTLIIILLTTTLQMFVWFVRPEREAEYLQVRITPELETIIKDSMDTNDGFF